MPQYSDPMCYSLGVLIVPLVIGVSYMAVTKVGQSAFKRVVDLINSKLNR